MKYLTRFMIAAPRANSKPGVVWAPARGKTNPVKAKSRQVVTSQQGLHPRLVERVLRHMAALHRRPVAKHNRDAFDTVVAALQEAPRPLVLDSFCGTGHSTAALARRHPGHLVVGIDKSADRLARHPGEPGSNYLLLQADCEDIWQLLAAAGHRVDYHYLLYPNPWPKTKHLQRRIHAHASFPLLLQLARGDAQAAPKATDSDTARGHIELRSNWQLYVEEFGVAMHLAGARGRVARVDATEPMTLFERKYRDSGHELWAYRAAIARREQLEG